MPIIRASDATVPVNKIYLVLEIVQNSHKVTTDTAGFHSPDYIRKTHEFFTYATREASFVANNHNLLSFSEGRCKS